MERTSPDGLPVCVAEPRRSFLKAALGGCAITPLGSLPMQLEGSLSQAQRDRLTPAEIIQEIKEGNERFRSGKMKVRNYLAQQQATATGQYPAAIVLGCIDSRAPAEIIFDVGIGDTFNARVAGNVVNDDMVGSMEFACAVSGAKVVLVLGHTACGAIKGAIDDVEMGNLTGLLARIKPAITRTKFDGDKSSKNYAYVDAVARTNVLVSIENVRRRSSILEDLEKKGSIRMVGAMYNVATGRAEFIS
jgi:carbonic anhydrase